MKKHITVIGTDSTHCVAFAKVLKNDSTYDWQISQAIRDNRSQLGLSKNRYQAIEEEMLNLGIDVYEDLTLDLVSSTDAFIIASVDASLHLSQLKKIIPYGKPIFIDKPMTYLVSEMKEMFDLAEKHEVQLMTSSSLRFSESVLTTKNKLAELSVEKLFLKGPMPIEEGIPGMFWYGIHLVELLLTLFEIEFSVESVFEKENSLDIICESQGLTCEFQGDLSGQGDFEGVIETKSGELSFNQGTDSKPLYAYLLDEMLVFFETGISPVSKQQTELVISLVEKINDKGGWR